MGHERHFDRSPVTSGLPLSTDIGSTGRKNRGRQLRRPPDGFLAKRVLGFQEALGIVFHYDYTSLAITKGWLVLDRSGTYVRFTPSGAELFA